MMNTLENNNHIKAGQKWEREAQQRSKDVSMLIKRLFAASGGDFDVLEAPLVDIVHERNRRLRNLWRSCGLRYRAGKFFLLPRDTYTVKEDELMRDLLVFAAFHELNLILTAAFHIAEMEAETNGSVSIPLGNGEEPFRVEVINLTFLSECVIAVVEQFTKVTCPALIARTLDVVDNEKAIHFLCGWTSGRISLFEDSRLRRALMSEYQGRNLEKQLLVELQAEIAVEFADIQANTKSSSQLNRMAKLHRTVALAVSKATARSAAPHRKLLLDFEQKEIQVSLDEEVLAKETLWDFKSLLTLKENEVWELDAKGFTEAEVAKQLGMKPKTVGVHRYNYKNKFRKRQSELL